MTEKENKNPFPFRKILLYGYGNPGRQDDGLGNAFIEELQKWVSQKNLSGIELESDYQLNIEDALTIADKDLVIFIDASMEEDIQDFKLSRVDPSNATIEFTMHAVSASFILDLCRKLYHHEPVTCMLHIRGYEWDFQEGITAKAEDNLKKALTFMRDHIENPQIFNNLMG
ncbi:MAG TPA: hydrogenase maturation protease [Bacteroidales bacterium]|nr:hydrogenase maturation protease [Bacteroidales bacterium]HRZ20303.1 hydrogenase maturation protease [Bacteroidales bacterium]